MADKKGMILIRFPDELADKLRRASFELNVPIKDIVSQIVEENLDVWFSDHALQAFGENEKALEKLEEVIGKQTDQTLISKFAVKLERIKETQKYLAKAAELIRHGVLPIETLLSEEDHFSFSKQQKSSLLTSNHKEPAKQARPSVDRNKKKTP
jgi:hypothetical protein